MGLYSAKIGFAGSRRVLLTSLTVCLALWLGTTPAQATKIVNYNILNYDGSGTSTTTREVSYRTILKAIDLQGDVDLICVQEIEGDSTAAAAFRDHVLNHADGPGSNPGGPYTLIFVNGTGGGGTPPGGGDNAMYYRSNKITLVSSQTIPTKAAGGIRDWTYHKARLAGYTSTAAELHIFIGHLSSGGGAPQRLIEAQVYRDWAEAHLASGANIICCGDFNLEDNTEGAWTNFTKSQGSNFGKLRDPAGRVGNWSTSSYQDVHTQSPYIASAPPPSCSSGCGYSGGGMDDRFDFLLTSDPLHNGSNMDYIAGSYKAYGNDAQHWNLGINQAPVIPEGQTMANALACASDHLPVVLQLQAPPKISTPSLITFGSVIVGATAEQTLTVTNVAPVPGVTLVYNMQIPAGFTGPPFQFFNEPAGNGGNSHTISMDTSTSGDQGGPANPLVVNSNSVDQATWNVTLFGQVLDHAIPSLNPSSQITSAAMNFGTHPAGGFADGTATIYNLPSGSLQAALEIYAAQVTGDPRFSVVNFTPTTVTSTPAQFPVHFDAAGASLDIYTAVLTFSTRDDQTKPGATELSPLTLNLSAVVGILGDFNGDGVNVNDIPTFINVLLDPASATPYQRHIADLNGDGINDGADIQLFVDALL